MSHYKPYPAYKDSGVEWLGRVPEHWTIGPYKATIQIENGSDYKEVEADDGYPVIGSGGPFAYSSKLMYDGESVLLGRKGTIDKPLYVNGAFWAVDTMYWSIIKPGAHGRFAYYTATTIPFDMYSTNTALPSMTKSVLGSHVVAFPGFEEQQAIAGHLDRETARIDALIEKKTRFIELLREKRQALITHAVTKGLDPSVKMKDSGVEWLGEVPEHWAVCKLSFRYSVELGKMLDEKRITSTSLMPYLRNQDVQWDAVNAEDLPEMDIHPEELSRYTVRAGDLLVCEGGDVGRAAIWRGENEVIGYQKALHRLRPRDATADTTEFFFFALMAAKTRGVFEESDSKATIAHLPAEKFRQYRFAFPPAHEQLEIAGHIRTHAQRLDKVQLETERSIALLKERRSALITAAVTGQIDLRETV